MAETIAASSPAEVIDPFNGEEVSLADYMQYRESGALPDKFKPAEPPAEEPADSPEETVESEAEEAETAAESEPEEEEAQEPPQKPSAAEKRIKQLLARVKELESKQPKQDAKPESSPAAPQQPQYTRPKPTPEEKNQDGSAKYATYEDFVEDLADWRAEQKLAQYQREQAQQAALNALKTKLDDARSRYEDADEVIFPAAQAINQAQIPPAVKQVFEDSDVFVDLCYVVGSDPDELQKFVSLAQTSPRAALAKVFEYERGIREELAKPAEPSGKAPEPKRTQAPKPPSPVGGGSSRAFDVSDESLSPDEWMRKRNQEIARRGR